MLKFQIEINDKNKSATHTKDFKELKTITKSETPALTDEVLRICTLLLQIAERP